MFVFEFEFVLFAQFNLKQSLDMLRTFKRYCGFYHGVNTRYNVQKLSNVSRRGPDATYFNQYYNVYTAFFRLAITGRKNIVQPLVKRKDTKLHILSANAEIYNYKDLAKIYGIKLTEFTSDTEVLLELLTKHSFDTIASALNGEYAIAYSEIDLNTHDQTLTIARDEGGVRPLFYGSSGFGVSVASAFDAIEYTNVSQLAGGIRKTFHWTNNSPLYKTTEKAFFDISTQIKWPELNHIPYTQSLIRMTLEKAVQRRMHSIRPIAALLSGGLDSSLVCSIAAQHHKRMYGKKLKTFSVGLNIGSSDEKYAKLAAKHIDSDHTHVTFSVNQFIDSIPEVIAAIGTYDITTVRASVPQYLLCKYIRHNTDIKVVLVGDGSDECALGYKYLKFAPNLTELDNEQQSLLRNIIYFDVLRADRTISAHGLECRTAFLDRRVISLFRQIPTKYLESRTQQEKTMLRDAFDVNNLHTCKPYLPESVLRRSKEALSDGISLESKSWHTILKKTFGNEEEYYRNIYENTFGSTYNPLPSSGFWKPKYINATDPSARTIQT